MPNPKFHFPIVIICVLGLFQTVHAQTLNTDSLKTELSKTKEDSVKLKLLMQLGAGDTFTDRKESIEYYKQALNLEIDQNQRGEILNKIGYAHWQLGNFNEAIVYYSEALSYFEELKDTLYLGRLYNNLATCYWGLADNIDALKYYQLSIDVRRKVNDKKGVSTVLNNLGKLYQELQLYDKALEIHREALDLALEIEDVNAITYSYSSIGDCYENFNDLKTALDYFKTGYKRLIEQDKASRSNSYFALRIGSAYLSLNKLDSALIYNRMAVDYAKQINNKQRIAIAQHSLGETFMALNRNDSARFYIDHSYTTAKEKGYEVLIKDNLFSRAKLEEKLGNSKKAYQLFKRASALNDSIYSKEVVAKVADLQVRYVNARQEQENAMLRKNNEIKEITIRQQRSITLFLIILATLIIIALFFMNKSRNSIKRLNKNLEKSREKLRLANKNKDRFFTIISHDLKTPFSGMLGLAELLENNYDNLSATEVKDMLRLLKEASHNSYSLLEDLLQWSRIQFKSTQYNFQLFDFHTSSSEVIKSITSSAQHKNITIKNNIEPNTYVLADKKSISAVLRNLLTNALKFTHEGGVIRIRATDNGKEYHISVSDNGIGITKDKISRLFSITEKISEPGTNNESGTGLGLILCKEFIEKNNGKIWVESKPGEGSTFLFSLPKRA